MTLAASTAAAFQPQPGTYWVIGEPGTAYNIEVQEGVLVATIYTYRDDGEPLWYLVAGAMQNGQRTLTAPLERYRGGNVLGAPQRAPTMVGWDGNISFNFVSPIAADVTLPTGRQVRIERFNFGHQAPPAGLAGEWVFVYDIGGISFANRYNLRTLGPAVITNGTGTIRDDARNAICEYANAGSLSGQVLCVDVNSSGTVTAQFVFTLALDEGYDGAYVSPTTGALYPMKAWRTVSANGQAKASADAHDLTAVAAAAESAGGATQRAPAALLNEFRNIGERAAVGR